MGVCDKWALGFTIKGIAALLIAQTGVIQHQSY